MSGPGSGTAVTSRPFGYGTVSPPLVLPITLIKWGCPYTENRRINVSKSCRVPLLTTLANLTLIIYCFQKC
jgi:hypothetical protein